MRSLVVAVQHNASSGALLNGQYGYGFNSVAEIGSEMELGRPDLFAININSNQHHQQHEQQQPPEIGVLLLFSYAAEQHTQVLYMSQPGTFEAIDISETLNEQSSTLAFGYDSIYSRAVQIVSSGIHVGKLTLTDNNDGGDDDISSSSSSMTLVWHLPNNAIAEHATINNNPNSNRNSDSNRTTSPSLGIGVSKP